MDPRERWKTLQAHLGTARARLEAQDRAGALEAIDAALAIDPEFLAAQSLRVRLLEERPPSADPAPAQPPACSNADLAGGLGRFEERARRRLG